MQGDDFEERLRRQPLRKLPGEWRNEILSAANAAVEKRHGASTTSTRASLSALKAHLVVLLWPSPKAWAGLAAIWVILIAVNHTAANRPRNFAGLGSEPASVMILGWKEQQQILTELTQPPKPASIQAPRQSAPSPRSERSGALRVVQSRGPSYV